MHYALSILFLALSEGYVPTKPAPPVAVVELFTAEGCSSCPLADEMLKELTDIMQKEGKHVLALAYHVTYWNHLGWVDPYSQEAFTERQKKYSKLLNVQGLYTPEAVVNGKHEFVGSNPVSFRMAVDSALRTPATYALEAHAALQKDSVKLTYTLSKEPKRVVLNVAIVEKYVEHRVLRGENKDRTLKHYHVVRAMEKILKPMQNGTYTLAWPADLPKENGEMIVYVQQTSGWSIVGGVGVEVE
ncbi:DUF1223 domain-containing protein [Chryseolinea lacunae]|uniref:DUF1223 domain-containing protein n=1 Tax=Chryseolinea lacunae TaxID=2801331 RepID=A0ABS1KNB5_9BACT|nr:DUF1223 domain-containing protein [Chryseolinea lacunae]MBL0740840.1 DUF1223 domain-containing protein [Chryseolinea lacunae]